MSIFIKLYMYKGNNCKKQAIYNYKGEIDALYCSYCKLDGMINIKHQKCIICNMIKKHNIVVIVNKRLMELSQDVGFRPIVFIRFNQDGYKITSCWYINKLEISN